MPQLDYYQVAHQASLEVDSHPGSVKLKHLCKKAAKVLDYGCGEGTRLNTLLDGRHGFGIDINPQAIKLANQQYPLHSFVLYSGERIPYPNSFFDLVYSAFVIEHTTDPENALLEMIRVLKPGGSLVILAPNFGAPNRRSPCSHKNPLLKLITGYLKDLRSSPGHNLNWTRVTPKKTYTQIDDDTTVEPYLYSLERYLNNYLTIKVSTSLWSLEEKTSNPRKLLFARLGDTGCSPFSYWGPQIFIHGLKKVKNFSSSI